MKILLTGQALSGLRKVAKLLEAVYDLSEIVTIGSDIDLFKFENNLRAGQVEDNRIFIGHVPWTESVVEACRGASCHIVLVVRNPYTMFQAIFLQANSPARLPHASILTGEEMDSAVCREYISTRFSEQLNLTASWLENSDIPFIQYERLSKNPVTSIRQLCDSLLSITQSGVEKGIANVYDSEVVFESDRKGNELRLPVKVVAELNKVIPGAFWSLNYEPLNDQLKEAMCEKIESFARHSLKHADKPRVFLVGHGKSGTTWLHMIFFNHPNTAAVAERRLIEHPDKNAALLDSLLGSEEFDSWFASSSFGKVYQEHRAVRFELSRLMSDYLAYRAIAMRPTAKGFHRDQPVTHFTEKIALNSKSDAELTMETLRHMYPDAKIVHIVRDPRDVAVSTLFHMYRNLKSDGVDNWLTGYIDAKESGSSVSAFAKTALRAFYKETSGSWKDIVSAFHSSGVRDYRINYCVVRYEDILESPSDSIRRILDFAGLKCDQGIIETVMEASSFSRLSQGRSGGEQDNTSFYRKGVSGDWANHLSAKKADKYFKSCQTVMSDFGYV
jgi:sulfotransferase family protein